MRQWIGRYTSTTVRVPVDSGPVTGGPVRQWTGRYTSTTVRVPVDSGQWTSGPVRQRTGGYTLKRQLQLHYDGMFHL